MVFVVSMTSWHRHSWLAQACLAERNKPCAALHVTRGSHGTLVHVADRTKPTTTSNQLDAHLRVVALITGELLVSLSRPFSGAVDRSKQMGTGENFYGGKLTLRTCSILEGNIQRSLRERVTRVETRPK
jgi:hypothetical protein